MPIDLFQLPYIESERPTAVVQLLTVARALIADERHWVQQRYETTDGRRCAAGAIRFATLALGTTPARSNNVANIARGILMEIAISRGYIDIENMNDYQTHAGVMNAFDRAISIAKEREATYA